MINKLKVGIIGCGRVADHYIKFIKRNPNIKIVSVCDKKKKKIQYFCKVFKCKGFLNYNDMLNYCKYDLILILTPSGLHYQHTKKALVSGFNVLVEKPIALRLNHALDLLKIAKRKKLVLEVAFQNRYNLAIVHLKNTLKKKRFGKIISTAVVLRWCRYQNYYNDEWHGKWKLDGGVISQQGIHHLDALNWLLGPIIELSSFSAKRLNKLEAEDTIVCNFKLKDGALSTLEATTASRPKDHEASISVVGEKGIVKIGGIALNKIETWDFIKKLKSDKDVIKKFSQNFKNGYGESHSLVIKNIINKILTKKLDYSSTEFAIQTTKLINGIYRSDEIKKSINMKKNINSKRLGL